MAGSLSALRQEVDSINFTNCAVLRRSLRDALTQLLQRKIFWQDRDLDGVQRVKGCNCDRVRNSDLSGIQKVAALQRIMPQSLFVAVYACLGACLCLYARQSAAFVAPAIAHS